MKIVINCKENKKLLQNFPDDPFSDITIITQYSRLNLVLAYLSIDSQFFSNLDFDTKQVDLSHLQQQPLIKVLKSLYGSQLIAYSVQQLLNIYQIIEQLQIEDYKLLLKNSLQQILATQKDNPILNSIQMLQFCIQNDILAQQFRNFHFDTKLKILESSKNYLQLNKVSQTTLATLLLDFNQLKVQKGDQIINHIMQNYFNRKNIRPAIFFNNFPYDQLKNIWQKYHHKINTTNDFFINNQQKSSISINLLNTVGNLSSLNQIPQNNLQRKVIMRKSQTNFDNVMNIPTKSQLINYANSNNTNQQGKKLDIKILTMQTQLNKKDQTIKKLRDQLSRLKSQKNNIKNNNHQDQQNQSDKQDSQNSLLLNLVKSKKNKQTAIINLDNVRQVQSFEASRDLNKAARKFGKNNQNKRIFQQIGK